LIKILRADLECGFKEISKKTPMFSQNIIRNVFLLAMLGQALAIEKDLKRKRGSSASPTRGRDAFGIRLNIRHSMGQEKLQLFESTMRCLADISKKKIGVGRAGSTQEPSGEATMTTLLFKSSDLHSLVGLFDESRISKSGLLHGRLKEHLKKTFNESRTSENYFHDRSTYSVPGLIKGYRKEVSDKIADIIEKQDQLVVERLRSTSKNTRFDLSNEIFEAVDFEIEGDLSDETRKELWKKIGQFVRRVNTAMEEVEREMNDQKAALSELYPASSFIASKQNFLSHNFLVFSIDCGSGYGKDAHSFSDIIWSILKADDYRYKRDLCSSVMDKYDFLMPYNGIPKIDIYRSVITSRDQSGEPLCTVVLHFLFRTRRVALEEGFILKYKSNFNATIAEHTRSLLERKFNLSEKRRTESVEGFLDILRDERNIHLVVHAREGSCPVSRHKVRSHFGSFYFIFLKTDSAEKMKGGSTGEPHSPIGGLSEHKIKGPCTGSSGSCDDSKKPLSSSFCCKDQCLFSSCSCEGNLSLHSLSPYEDMGRLSPSCLSLSGENLSASQGKDGSSGTSSLHAGTSSSPCKRRALWDRTPDSGGTGPEWCKSPPPCDAHRELCSSQALSHMNPAQRLGHCYPCRGLSDASCTLQSANLPPCYVSGNPHTVNIITGNNYYGHREGHLPAFYHGRTTSV
jgi:hypothetical protein